MLMRSGRRALLAGAVAVSAGLIAQPLLAQDVPEYEGVDQLPEIKLTITQSESPQSSFGRASQVFADYVTAASKGKITFEIFWSASLMGPTEVADGLAAGLADIGSVAPSYDPASFPMANWLTQLAGQSRGGSPYAGLTFGMAQWELGITEPQLVKSFEDRGLKVLGAQAIEGYSLLCREPIPTLADAKGKRVRTAGVVFAKEAESLGMVPVPLLPTEIYEGFSRGIVNCVMHTPTGYINYGITEVDGPKVLVNSMFAGFSGAYTCIAKAKWDTLPLLAQRILLDGFAAQTIDSLNSDLGQLRKFADMIDAGKITATDADADFKASLKAHQDAIVANLAAQAPPGVEDPQAVVDRFMALIEKWRGIAGEEGFQPYPGDVQSRIASWRREYDFGPITVRIRDEIGKALGGNS